MIRIEDKISCCGCNACVQACPKKCISLVTDNEGFWYPEVQYDECISCNMCEKVCPIQNKTSFSDEVLAAYAGHSVNEAIISASSSGGVFSELALYVLEQNGVVFGAAFDGQYRVHHICIDNISDLHLLQGSKYLQSDIGQSYKEAEKYLLDGRLVLFSGTPCQISGLHSFLGKEYDGLISLDILCHGVPSPLVWRRYLDELKQLNKCDEIKKISFRAKPKGWLDYYFEAIFNGGIKYSCSHKTNPFMRLFLGNICLRPSCHECKFKKLGRKSDITLGDCWGVENVLPELFYENGVSIIIVHSHKGEVILEKIKSIVKKKADVNVLLPPSSDSRKSVKEHRNRRKFFVKMQKSNSVSELTRYLEPSLLNRLKRKMKKIFRLG